LNRFSSLAIGMHTGVRNEWLCMQHIHGFRDFCSDCMFRLLLQGIQHLCSELLEIKKASEQDFSANVYLSYLSFIRYIEK
jgi:hypothetical protein